jgi:hypothetical protein
VREWARYIGLLANRSRAVREPPLPFLAGALYEFLCGFGVVVAQDAAGQRVIYLVVTACIPVDDDRIVAISDLLYGVLGRALLFAHLASWVGCKEDILIVTAIGLSAVQLPVFAHSRWLEAERAIRGMSILLPVTLEFPNEDGYLCRSEGLALRGSKGNAPHEACAYGSGTVRGEGVQEVLAWPAPAGRTVFDPEQWTGQIRQPTREVLPDNLGGQIT